MLEFLEGQAGERKLRLFSCACCRRIWHLLVDRRARQAVEVAERLADGATGSAELDQARSLAAVASREADRASYEEEFDVSPYTDKVTLTRVRAATAAAALGAVSAEPEKRSEHRTSSRCCGFAVGAAAEFAAHATASQRAELDLAEVSGAEPNVAEFREREHQAVLIREIVGNPFRPAAIEPAWLTWSGGTVVRLAEAAYEHRALPEGTLDPLRLAVLADAIEEAGCADTYLPEHLRGPGPHVRGCFAVDLLRRVGGSR